MLSNWILYIIQDNLLLHEHFLCDFSMDSSTPLQYHWSGVQSLKQKKLQAINYRVCDGKIYYDDAPWFLVSNITSSGFILWMRAANERQHYTVTPSVIGWAHAQNDPCFLPELQTTNKVLPFPLLPLSIIPIQVAYHTHNNSKLGEMVDWVLSCSGPWQERPLRHWHSKHQGSVTLGLHSYCFSTTQEIKSQINICIQLPRWQQLMVLINIKVTHTRAKNWWYNFIL